MNVSRLVETGLWGAAVALLVTAAAGARAPRTGVSAVPRGASRAAETADVNGDAAASQLVAEDPFRAARHPSPIAYRPDIEGAPPPPPRASRPALGVSGIVGGPPWSAVLEGVPGREGGALVQAGDTLGGLKVRMVRRDTVVITGMDTTWRLIVRRAW